MSILNSSPVFKCIYICFEFRFCSLWRRHVLKLKCLVGDVGGELHALH
jgi:hypothetical protein